MIFALAKDELCLRIFRDERETIAYCEAIDVAGGIWLFFDAEGRHLKAVFEPQPWIIRFIDEPSQYHLEPDPSGKGASLVSYLGKVRIVDQDGKRISIEQLKRLMAKERP